MHMNFVIGHHWLALSCLSQDDHFYPKEISLGEGFHQGTSDGRNIGSWTCTFWVVQQGYLTEFCQNPGAEPPRNARDSGSARSHSTHLETSSSDRP